MAGRGSSAWEAYRVHDAEALRLLIIRLDLALHPQGRLAAFCRHQEEESGQEEGAAKASARASDSSRVSVVWTCGGEACK